jgi:hypothetical protein
MKLPAIAAAALALTMPLASHAAATSSAHFSNFRLEIIDLDLNDGIDAAITLEDSIVLGAGFQPSIGEEPEPFNVLLEEGSVDAAVSGGHASATLTGGAAGTSASFGGTYGDMFSSAAMGSLFTLTANTRLVLRVDASVSGQFDGNDFGAGDVHLFISNRDTPFEVDEDTIYDTLRSDEGGSLSRELTLSLTTGAYGTDGNFAVGAAALAGVSAVPEPSQYAMFGLGLAGLGWRLRRSPAGRRESASGQGRK